MGAGLAAGLVLCCLLAIGLQKAPPPATSAASPSVADSYGKAPLAFSRAGAPAGADFAASTAAGSIALGPTGAVITKQTGDRRATTIPVMLAGAAASEPRPVGKLPGVVNDLRGDDSAAWRTNVPTFARVRYPDVYPGIAMDYHGTTGTLEYDFRLAPQADPSRIAVGFGGAPLRIGESGALVVGSPGKSIRQAAPVAYQPNADGTRDPVAASFDVQGGKVGFDLGAYDHARPLVIDPLVLSYSTFLGGNDQEETWGITVDGSGNAYVVGDSPSSNFPTTAGAYKTATFSANNYDVTVSKLNPTGSALVYSTFIGGSSTDIGRAIAVDSTGNAYLTGQTYSEGSSTAANNFPTTAGGAFPASNDQGISDVFVTKLNPTGTALVYSATFGGTDTDVGRSIVLDSNGAAYIGGKTQSSGTTGAGPNLTPFPTTAGAAQTSYGGNSADGFVAKVNASGTGLVYSTFLGGNGQDEVSGIDIDSLGRAYVAGFSTAFGSNNFPTTAANRYEPVDVDSSDAFLTRLSADGTTRQYSTGLGGDGSDQATDVAVGADGIAYITGSTSTGAPNDFDLKNQYSGRDGSCCTPGDLFVSKFDTDASGANSLVYSTMIGGDQPETGSAIEVDSSGSAYIAGTSGSTSNDPYDTTSDALAGRGTAIVTKLSPAGNSLVWSTMIPNGGFGGDEASAIAIGDDGSEVYVAGTSKGNAPLVTTAGAFQTTHPGNWDGFVVKITPDGTADTTPPDTSITSGPAEGATVNTSSVSFAFSATENPATFQCKWDNEAYSACASPSSRNLADGPHTFSVKAKDASNNEDLTAATRSFTVSTGPPPDTTPPNTSITKAPASMIKSKKLPVDASFSFSSSEGGSTFKCSIDGKAASTCTSPAKFSLGKGKHTFSVYATDSSGNVDATPATATVTVKKKKKKRRH